MGGSQPGISVDGPVITEPVPKTTLQSMETIRKRLELNCVAWRRLRYIPLGRFQFFSVGFHELSEYFILKAE